MIRVLAALLLAWLRRPREIGPRRNAQAPLGIAG